MIGCYTPEIELFTYLTFCFSPQPESQKTVYPLTLLLLTVQEPEMEIVFMISITYQLNSLSILMV